MRDSEIKTLSLTKGALFMSRRKTSFAHAIPFRRRKLLEGINRIVCGEPSIKAISQLVDDVAEAKKITDSFSIGPNIESFLKKVSLQQARKVL